MTRHKKVRSFPVLLIVLIAIIGAFFLFKLPAASPVQNVDETIKAVHAIKAYAAFQFNVPENKVTLLSSKKEQWDTICLGMKIPNYDCVKKKLSGYEVAVRVNGMNINYRSSDDGSNVRVVK